MGYKMWANRWWGQLHCCLPNQNFGSGPIVTARLPQTRRQVTSCCRTMAGYNVRSRWTSARRSDWRTVQLIAGSDRTTDWINIELSCRRRAHRPSVGVVSGPARCLLALHGRSCSNRRDAPVVDLLVTRLRNDGPP